MTSPTTPPRVRGELLVSSQTANGPTAPTVTGLTNGNFLVTWEDASATLGDASGRSVKAQLFSATGSRLGSEFLVNTQTLGDQSAPAVTALPDGGFVVTWTDASGTLGDASGTSIKAQRFDAGAARRGSEFLVNTQTTGNQDSPSVAGRPDGSFVVTWTDSYKPTYWTLGIKSQFFDAEGLRVDREHPPGSGNSLASSVTALTNGQFAMTFKDSGDVRVVRLIDAVGRQSFPYVVNTHDGITLNPQAPRAAGLGNGGFVVAWGDESGTLGDASAWSIHAQLFGADSARMGSEFLVNTETAGSQWFPAVAGLGQGGFVVAWEDGSGTLGDASGTSIKAQLFDGAGGRVGSEFLVNTRTGLSQSAPTVAGLANGGFVVAWVDETGMNGQADGTRIKAQIFGPVSTFSVSAPGVVAEDAGPLVFTITRRFDTTAEASVSYAVSGSGPAPVTADDFPGSVLPAGRVTFAPGETSKSISLALTDDMVFEADEGFAVTLSAPSAGTTLGIPTASGVLRNDDALLSIAFPLLPITEGVTGFKLVKFSVARSGDTSGISTANWSVDGLGDAPVDAADFVHGRLPSGTVVFAPGETTKTINLGILADGLAEPSESFAVTLSAPTGASLGPAPAVATIVDGDGILGTAGADSLRGTGASESLVGGDGNDTVLGRNGDDTLYGGLGADRLWGDAGADVFVYRRRLDSPIDRRDVIRDFDPTEGDRIDLSRMDADPTLPGHQAFVWAGGGVTSLPYAIRVTSAYGDTYVSLDFGHDGSTDFGLVLTDVFAPSLTAAQFLL